MSDDKAAADPPARLSGEEAAAAPAEGQSSRRGSFDLGNALGKIGKAVGEALAPVGAAVGMVGGKAGQHLSHNLSLTNIKKNIYTANLQIKGHKEAFGTESYDAMVAGDMEKVKALFAPHAVVIKEKLEYIAAKEAEIAKLGDKIAAINYVGKDRSKAYLQAQKWGANAKVFNAAASGAITPEMMKKAGEDFVKFYAETFEFSMPSRKLEMKGTTLPKCMETLGPIWSGFKYVKPTFSIAENEDGTVTLTQKFAKTIGTTASGAEVEGTAFEGTFTVTNQFTFNDDNLIVAWVQGVDNEYVDKVKGLIAKAEEEEAKTPTEESS